VPLRAFKRERATTTVVVNDWESVIENDQTESLDPIRDGVIRREQVHELGDLILAAPSGGAERWFKLERRSYSRDPRKPCELPTGRGVNDGIFKISSDRGERASAQ
jgi:hypothetical protein